MAAVHRRHEEQDAGVQELGGVPAEAARGAECAGCSLRNRVMSGQFSSFIVTRLTGASALLHQNPLTNRST